MDFFESGTAEKITPENMGVDTEIMFLSGRIATMEEFPLAPYVTKFYGSPRVNEKKLQFLNAVNGSQGRPLNVKHDARCIMVKVGGEVKIGKKWPKEGGKF